MKTSPLIFPGLLLILGCAPTPANQLQVRRDVANATSAVVSDARAAALGVRDGLKRDLDNHAAGPVDINTASPADLETLPGITPAAASQIVAHRPYRAASDLRRRKIVSQDEYDRIASRLAVTP